MGKAAGLEKDLRGFGGKKVTKISRREGKTVTKEGEGRWCFCIMFKNKH